jgi:hypothetical protein
VGIVSTPSQAGRREQNDAEGSAGFDIASDTEYVPQESHHDPNPTFRCIEKARYRIGAEEARFAAPYEARAIS